MMIFNTLLLTNYFSAYRNLPVISIGLSVLQVSFSKKHKYHQCIVNQASSNRIMLTNFDFLVKKLTDLLECIFQVYRSFASELVKKWIIVIIGQIQVGIDTHYKTIHLLILDISNIQEFCKLTHQKNRCFVIICVIQVGIYKHKMGNKISLE